MFGKSQDLGLGFGGRCRSRAVQGAGLILGSVGQGILDLSRLSSSDLLGFRV